MRRRRALARWIRSACHWPMSPSAPRPAGSPECAAVLSAQRGPWPARRAAPDVAVHSCAVVLTAGVPRDKSRRPCEKWSTEAAVSVSMSDQRWSLTRPPEGQVSTRSRKRPLHQDNWRNVRLQCRFPARRARQSSRRRPERQAGKSARMSTSLSNRIWPRAAEPNSRNRPPCCACISPPVLGRIASTAA